MTIADRFRIESGDSGNHYTLLRNDGPYASHNLQEIVDKIYFTDVHKGVLEKISLVIGTQLDMVEVREGTLEELGTNKGIHISAEESEDGVERILLSPRYIKPGSRPEDTARTYDDEFIFYHGHSNLPELSKDPFLRIYNLMEDILTHEYAHKVYDDIFKPIILASKEAQGRMLVYADHSNTFNEGFARWLMDTALGHQHPGEIFDLETFSTQQIKRQGGDPAYRNRSGIVEAYRLLKSLSDERGVKYVMDNLPEIALDHFKVVDARDRPDSSPFKGLIIPEE